MSIMINNQLRVFLYDFKYVYRVTIVDYIIMLW